MMKRLRVYADTSVFGGCFDEEFKTESVAFFEAVRKGTFKVVVSLSVLAELSKAPDRVRNVLASLPDEAVEMTDYTDKIGSLRDAYVAAGIVDKSSLLDAEHIAYASVAGVDMLISLNFKHIVHYDKISGYQAVNLLNGYKPIIIYSPREVVEL
jgi:hypothetical protein